MLKQIGEHFGKAKELGLDSAFVIIDRFELEQMNQLLRDFQNPEIQWVELSQKTGQIYDIPGKQYNKEAPIMVNGLVKARKPDQNGKFVPKLITFKTDKGLGITNTLFPEKQDEKIQD